MKRIVKRSLIWSGVILLVLVSVAAIVLGPPAYRVLVGLKRYETVPPILPALSDRAILIFSKTNGFRDDAQIEAANAALARIAREQGWSPYVTENGAVFNPAQLARFKAVVWNSVSGDVLTPAQRAAFKSYLEQGGGFVGLHGAGGDFKYAWSWYVNDLIGAQFIGHTYRPQFQQAVIHIEDPAHPAMQGLGSTWTRTEEWYSFTPNPRAKGYHILATVDEATYRPVFQLLPFGEARDIRMGDHPVIWTHCIGNGRAFYSALGHRPEAYAEAKHLQMLRGAIAWAAGFEGSKCVHGVEQAVAPQPAYTAAK